jgi:hypothetical protein
MCPLLIYTFGFPFRETTQGIGINVHNISLNRAGKPL